MLQFKVAIYCRAGAGAGAEAKNMDKGGAGAENRSFRLRNKLKQNSKKHDFRIHGTDLGCGSCKHYY